MAPLLLLAAWLGGAWAAVPVALPPGEPAAAWVEAARLAGARLGAASGAPSAVVTARGARWSVRVVARDGTVHTLDVAAPTSAAAREDLLATIVSLAEPVRVSLPTLSLPEVAPKPATPPKAAPKAPPKPKPPAPPTPIPAPESPPIAAPARSDTPADTTDVSPVASEPTDTRGGVAGGLAPPPQEEAIAVEPNPITLPDELPPADPPALLDLDTAEAEPPAGRELYARLSTGAVFRLDADPTAALALTGGVGLGPGRLGLSVAAALPATLAGEGASARSVRSVDLALLYELGDLGPWGAARAGLAIRGWTEARAPVGTTFTPAARLDAGWAFAIGPGRLRPSAWAAADLAPTDLYVDGIQEATFNRFSFGIDLGVELSREKK